jgi:hypothetical protein
MGKMTAIVVLAVSGNLTAGSLNAGPLPGFALTAQTPHFAFYSRDHERVDAERSEVYLVKVERLLGQRVQGQAEYYRYSSPEELAASTGTYAAGVTYAGAGQIHSTEAFHAHEIVHLVAGQLGNPGAFFQEGLAVAIGNAGKWNGKDVDTLARATAKGARLSALVTGFDRLDAQISYPAAGSFVSMLIQKQGIAKVAEFFRACDGRNTEQAFARAFGQTLDEAGAAWARGL